MFQDTRRQDNNTHRPPSSNPQEGVDQGQRLDSQTAVDRAQQQVLGSAAVKTQAALGPEGTTRTTSSKQSTTAEVTTAAAKEVDGYLDAQRRAGNLSWAEHGAARDKIMAEVTLAARGAAEQREQEEKAQVEKREQLKKTDPANHEELLSTTRKLAVDSPAPTEHGLGLLGRALKEAAKLVTNSEQDKGKKRDKDRNEGQIALSA